MKPPSKTTRSAFSKITVALETKPVMSLVRSDSPAFYI